MKKLSVLMVVLVALLVAPVWAQDVYYPGNGVILPMVVKEIHLMGPTEAKVGIDCVVMADGRIGAATVASSPDAKLNNAAV